MTWGSRDQRSFTYHSEKHLHFYDFEKHVIKHCMIKAQGTVETVEMLQLENQDCCIRPPKKKKHCWGVIFRSGVHLHYVWLMTGGELTGGSSFRRWLWKRGGLPSGWCFIKGIHCPYITHHHCKLTLHTLHSSEHFTQIKTSAYIHTL